MKIYSLILIALLALSTQTYGQWTGFDVYYLPDQWYNNTQAYANEVNFKNYVCLTQGGITPSVENDTTISPKNIKWYIEKHVPNVGSEEIVILDWESEIFKWIRDYPETDPKFKYAEMQWIALINEVRKLRPNVKLGIYGVPFRSYTKGQMRKFNQPGALDNIISKIDIITPSVYLGYSEEERGKEYNYEYLKDNLDMAMVYAKRHNKPVMPYVWHRILMSNKANPHGILRPEVFSDYIKYIKDYSNDGFKVSGVFIWDDPYKAPRLRNLSGIENWLKGTVKDEPTYDKYTISMMKSIVAKLNK